MLKQFAGTRDSFPRIEVDLLLIQSTAKPWFWLVCFVFAGVLESFKKLGAGAIAGIVIAVILLVLIAIDFFCCFFNSCGLIFCCQQALCGGGGGKGEGEGAGGKDDCKFDDLSENMFQHCQQHWQRVWMAERWGGGGGQMSVISLNVVYLSVVN